MIVYIVRDHDGYIQGRRARPFFFHPMKADAEKDARETNPKGEVLKHDLKTREDLCNLMNLIGDAFEIEDDTA